MYHSTEDFSNCAFDYMERKKLPPVAGNNWKIEPREALPPIEKAADEESARGATGRVVTSGKYFARYTFTIPRKLN